MIKEYKEINDVFGESQVYKNIEFKPLKLKDYEMYNFVRILSLYHKKINDEFIKKMSFVKFLIIYLIESDLVKIKKVSGTSKNSEYDLNVKFLKYIYMLFSDEKHEDAKVLEGVLDAFSERINNFDSIVKLREFIAFVCCVECSDVEFDLKFTKMGLLLVHLKIGKSDFNDAEFENIRQIILKQSGVDFDFVKSYNEESEKKLNVLNKDCPKQATLEEQIFTFSLILNKNPAELKEYTFYQISGLTKRNNLLSDYNTYKSLEAAGFIKFKDKTISHYLSHIEKANRYDDLYMNVDKFKKDVLDKL